MSSVSDNKLSSLGDYDRKRGVSYQKKSGKSPFTRKKVPHCTMVNYQLMDGLKVYKGTFFDVLSIVK